MSHPETFRTLTSVLVCLLTLAACLSPGDAADPGTTGDPTMDHPVRMLATGLGPVGPQGDPPTLTVVLSETAWRQLVAAQHTLSNKADLPEANWSSEVLLWVRSGSLGDSSQEVRIEGISREGDRVRVSARLMMSPGAEDLDFFASPWGLAAGPREALADATEIELSLDGRGGSVETLH